MDRPKIRIATTSLAGCFGCHMSFLDIDERLLELTRMADFDRSPLTDIKQLGRCDIGIIEGGVCNAENVEVLRQFRERCTHLVAIGACAINGGIPALRNRYPLEACLEEAYLRGEGLHQPAIPDDPELPPLLEKVLPVHEVVQVDYTIPGCPPSADAIWSVLCALLAGREPELPRPLIHYD
ncbi:MAG: NADP oxidoreductase [Gammaproteobacteria bacterium]|nr:MAG: NADP oxidoreductase [Gammaproteobacteria bacterium]